VLGSHSFRFGPHSVRFKSLFSIPLRLIVEQHFQHQSDFGLHIYTILISNFEIGITNIVIDWVIIVSLTWEVLVEVIVIVIFSLNLQ
jgi:hypothetical protein